MLLREGFKLVTLVTVIKGMSTIASATVLMFDLLYLYSVLHTLQLQY